MLPEDQEAFFRVVKEKADVVVIQRDTDSADIQGNHTVTTGADPSLCLWNRGILPNLERKWVPEPGYYSIDILSLPVLEFHPPFVSKWQGAPAVAQGRLFGNFESYLKKPEQFEAWYEGLVRWIRKNYQRNPAGQVIGGYVGPAAMRFYEQGGYLLPNFLPPTTKEWLSIIGRQHTRQQERHRRS
jgi:hypothetical protein